MVRVALYAVFVALSTGLACARPYPPTGGDPDVTPPQLVGTVPAPLALVAPSTEPVIFRFDNTLSERGFSEALIIVSPRDSAVRLDREGNEVRVRIDGGWRADRVYRVVLLPGLSDRFGNEREESIELVFSTGPPVPNTALAGIVLDRITGQPALNPVIDAVRRADGAHYMAVGDSGGFYALRHLPPGVYEMRAFSDANGNRRRDATEPLDSGRVASLTVSDTVPQLFYVLAPDTTPPNVNNATYVDSLHVRVVLDDFVTAEAAAEGDVRVLLLSDSTVFAARGTILLQPVHAAMVRATAAAVGVPARTDSVPPATGDTVADAGVRTVDPATVARAEAAVAAALELPARELIVRIDRPLVPGIEYVIELSGLTNLHGLTGGGSAPFEAPALSEPPPGTSDTTAGLTTRR